MPLGLPSLTSEATASFDWVSSPRCPRPPARLQCVSLTPSDPPSCHPRPAPALATRPQHQPSIKHASLGSGLLPVCFRDPALSNTALLYCRFCFFAGQWGRWGVASEDSDFALGVSTGILLASPCLGRSLFLFAQHQWPSPGQSFQVSKAVGPGCADPAHRAPPPGSGCSCRLRGGFWVGIVAQKMDPLHQAAISVDSK